MTFDRLPSSAQSPSLAAAFGASATLSTDAPEICGSPGELTVVLRTKELRRHGDGAARTASASVARVAASRGVAGPTWLAFEPHGACSETHRLSPWQGETRASPSSLSPSRAYR